MKNLKLLCSIFCPKERVHMNFFKENEEHILLYSKISYFDKTAYLHLLFLNGELTLKSTDLISVSYEQIYLLKENKNMAIRIDPRSEEKEINKLQRLFKEALSYESTCLSCVRRQHSLYTI
ncbi:hypothetical protein OQH45_19430 [Acinetobacter baumannii]|nr:MULTISPECIES: hypothetical protein [Acinetobacter calcoaceticus/baumannii complex]MCW8693057.1 hypothetical protein [Acinetobacter baumannii]